jgi:two-component system chemotaxis sensor kinase CheA
MAAFDHLRTTYFEECAELLDAAYTHLAAIAEGRADDDTVNAVFRAFHSIKGGGGAFGFERLVGFAHELETVLDLLRDGRLAMAAPVAALLLRSTDTLSDLVAATRAGQDKPPGFEDELVEALRDLAVHPAAPLRAVEPAVAAAVVSRWRVRFVPHAGLFRSANEPLLIIRQLKRLGDVRVEADLSRLPHLAELDPEEAYLAWTLFVETAQPRGAIEAVFEFVGDDCDLTITAATAAGPADHPAAAPANETPAALAPSPSIRVDVEKVDRLVNLVGELVINQAMLAQLGSQLPPEMCAGLLNGLDTLAVSGEGTEIDKTVIEQLADPLTHLLRNALDHGIETPEERLAAGKPRQGTIFLSAEHRGGRIVIEVADDGRGIPRPKVLAKARDRGLVAQDAVLNDEEIDHLIFLPGLSTSEALSDISGRGVGMDVVKRNIQALGGRIAVQSRDGTGSRFQLSLPLTLAILDGMAVAVGAESYIVPLTNIMESLRPRPDNIHPVTGHGDVLAIRGEYVPLVYLHQRFKVPDAVTDPCKGIVVIVESEGANRIGLVVDDLLGQQQVVVKSLEANYGPVEGVGGATVLGDGRVALILDVSRLKTASTFSAPVERRAAPPMELH